MRILPIIPLIPTQAVPAQDVVLRHDGAVEIPPGAALLHLAAETPCGPGDTRDQTLRALRSIAARLARFGLGLDDLVRVQAALAPDPALGSADAEGFGTAWREAFGNAPQPLLSLLRVTALDSPDCLVTIEATAARHVRAA
jgi:enamine deaminase RidA (YjgF/YER057c/UK114 family)